MENSNNTILSVQKANALKGILAMCVLASHVYGYGIFHFESSIINFLFGSLMGYLPVSLFFFLSGYGLESSYEKKGKNYIVTFLLIKILPFYVIYIILLGIYLLVHLIVDEHISLISIIKSLTYGGTLITFGWFLQTILVLYVIFWLSYLSDIKLIYKIHLLTISHLLFCFISYAFEFPTTWYATSVCFLIGIYWKYYEKQIIEKINNRIIMIICCVGGGRKCCFYSE